VAHNVALNVLHDRIAHPTPGRYWWVTDGPDITGYAWQSPPGFSAGLVPSSTAAAHALADRVLLDVPDLPGVTGDAGTAAAFTGRWTEQASIGAAPREGERVYRLDRVEPVPPATGAPRAATPDDVGLIVGWLEAFHSETDHDIALDLGTVVPLRVAEGLMWLWDDGGPVALTRLTQPVSGVVRVGPVYTPPERRGHGYATALVAFLSQRVLNDGARALMLFTQLSNSTSNGIYRRIGFRSVGEVLSYRFDR
jgi:predicted GNAT family acetyltransferase